MIGAVGSLIRHLDQDQSGPFRNGILGSIVLHCCVITATETIVMVKEYRHLIFFANIGSALVRLQLRGQVWEALNCVRELESQPVSRRGRNASVSSNGRSVYRKGFTSKSDIQRRCDPRINP